MSPGAYPIRDQTLVEFAPTPPGKPHSDADLTPGEGPHTLPTPTPDPIDPPEHRRTIPPCRRRAPDRNTVHLAFPRSTIACTGYTGSTGRIPASRRRTTHGFAGPRPATGGSFRPRGWTAVSEDSPDLGVLQLCTVHRRMPAKGRPGRLDFHPWARHTWGPGCASSGGNAI